VQRRAQAAVTYLAAPRRDYPRATDLLGQSQALLREVRDDDLTGYDRLQHLLTIALVDNFLGQVRLSQGDNDAAARLFTDGMSLTDHIPARTLAPGPELQWPTD
jgi:hypothetical protein